MKKIKYILIIILIIILTNNSKFDIIKPVISYNNNINIITEPDKIEVLVNKNNQLPNNYIPKELIKLDTKYSMHNQYLKKEAYNAFINMYNDALKENIYIYIASAYRSYNYQEYIYNKSLLEHPSTIVETYRAKPGHSEHQTGLAIDIIKKDYKLLTENDIEYSWLINNSYKYGYILRYPTSKEKITGYIHEPWHFRYLGINIATTLYNNNITYEEYIEKSR